jgi:hypothetical protein
VNTSEALTAAKAHLDGLAGHVFDVLSVGKPISPDAAVNLAKVISKLSPLVGNMLEFNTVEILDEQEEFRRHGKWIRQDPGFPDTIFVGDITPAPGLEIKAWFPLATEITARFKDSQKAFEDDNISVALIAWLPEFLIFGRPKIISTCVVSARSVAEARDHHYHNPPDYLVVEPEDTSERTRNLQQSNTAGYKWQGSTEEFREAEKLVGSWGPSGEAYRPDTDYQPRVRELMARYNYRLDTNFAKMDRIFHPEIEAFKSQTYSTIVHGRSIAEWNRILSSNNDEAIRTALATQFDIKEVDAEQLIE